MPLYKDPKFQKQITQNFLESILNGFPEAFYIKGRDGKLLAVNQAHYEGSKIRLNNGSESVVGEPDDKIHSSEEAKKIEASEQTVWRGNILYDFLEKTKYPDGIFHTVSTTKIPLVNSKGDIYALAGITRDITGRVHFYRHLCEHYPGGVFITDAEGEILYISRNGAKLLGFGGPENVERDKAAKFFKKRRVWYDFIKRVQKNRQGTAHIATDLLRENKKGLSEFPSSINVWSRKDSKNDIVGYHGTFEDITQTYMDRYKCLTYRQRAKFYLLVTTDHSEEAIAKVFKISVDGLRSDISNICKTLNKGSGASKVKGREGLIEFSKKIGLDQY